MQKTLQGSVISIQDIQNKGFKIILATLFLLLIVLGGIGAVLFQSPLQQSQELRKDASFDEGSVIVSAESSATPFVVNTTSAISFKINTQNIPVETVSLVFNVVTDTFDIPFLNPSLNSNLQITTSQIEQTTDGYLIHLVVTTSDGLPFRSSTPMTFAELVFSPHRNGQISLDFDTESSTAIRTDQATRLDALKTIAAVNFDVVNNNNLPSCTYNYSDWTYCQNNRQVRTVLSKSPDNCSGEPVVSQSCESSITSINWETDHVKITADEFYIIANGQKFNRPFTNFSINTDAPNSDSDGYTTLETTWTENNIPMRLYIYFKHDGTDWWSNEMRIYNGYSSGDWIYFEKNKEANTTNEQKNGAFFTTKLGDNYNRTGETTFTTSVNGIGELHFKNLRLQAFTKYGNSGGYSMKQCNETCSNNSQCGVNQRCYNNRCRLVTNVTSTSCSNPPDLGLQRSCNEYCADSKECSSGLSCYYNRCRRADNPSSQSCALLTSSSRQQMSASCNQSCSTNSECSTNLLCYQYRCRLATNPSSSSCSAPTYPSISTTVYGSKGGLNDGNSDENELKPNASNSGMIATTPFPKSSPESITGSLNMDELEDKSENSLDALSSLFVQNGLTIPFFAAITGGIILLVLLFLMLTKIFSSRDKNKPTPPIAPTPQMKSLENKISNLQQQQQHAQPIVKPIANTSPASVINYPPTTLPTPKPVIKTLPVPPTYPGQKTTTLPNSNPQLPQLPKHESSRPAATPPVPVISAVPAATTPKSALSGVFAPTPQLQSKPVVPSQFHKPAQSTHLPLASAKTLQLEPSDQSALPAHSSQKTIMGNQPQPQSMHHSSMMARIRAKGLVKDSATTTEIFNSKNRSGN